MSKDYTENDEGIVLSAPPIRSRLIIGSLPCALVFELHTKRPNWWFRLWQRLILGFRWERVGR